MTPTPSPGRLSFGEMKDFLPFGLFILVFAVPLFLVAGWLLLVAPQPLWVKLFASAVTALGGLWNAWRGWNRLRPRRNPSDGKSRPRLW